MYHVTTASCASILIVSPECKNVFRATLRSDLSELFLASSLSIYCNKPNTHRARFALEGVPKPGIPSIDISSCTKRQVLLYRNVILSHFYITVLASCCAISINELMLDLLCEQEAQLSQRDRVTRYFCKFVLFHEVWEIGLERFQSAKWPSGPSGSFMGIGNSAIQYVTCDFILVFHCNYVSSMHHFRDAITYFPKFKNVTWLNTPILGIIYHACTSTTAYQCVLNLTILALAVPEISVAPHNLKWIMWPWPRPF